MLACEVVVILPIKYCDFTNSTNNRISSKNTKFVLSYFNSCAIFRLFMIGFPRDSIIFKLTISEKRTSLRHKEICDVAFLSTQDKSDKNAVKTKTLLSCRECLGEEYSSTNYIIGDT